MIQESQVQCISIGAINAVIERFQSTEKVFQNTELMRCYLTSETNVHP
jgi:hypothetical protein